jgi:hypothetical protein
MPLPFRSLDAFYAGAAPCLERFDAFCAKHALVGKARPDHFCYKCDSHETFEQARALFEAECQYLYQSLISKRRIAYIKLGRPLPTKLGDIFFLELSDQKPDGSQTNRYDHIEVFPTEGSYEDMVAALAKTEQVTEEVRPHHTTHDIDIGGGFLFRGTREPLIDKIKREEML